MFALFRAAFLSFFLIMIGVSTAVAADLRANIEYGRVNGVSLRMDASIPNGPGPFPAAIIVHGGAWVAGDRKRNVQPLFEPLSDAGFAWFSISYRLASDISQFGLAIDDVQQAIRYVKSHAAEFRVDPNRIALVGESAGGQLAAMATLRGGADTKVKAVVALYAPTDIASLAKTSNYVPSSVRDSVRGTPWEALLLAGLAQLSPINNVRHDMPPFLFIHGTADSMVPFEQSRTMCDRMKAAGADCAVYPVKGGGHGILWWDSVGLGSGYKRKMVEWLEQELEKPDLQKNGHSG
jgi:acetyl esterase